MAILMTTVKTVFLFITCWKAIQEKGLDDFGHSCKFLDKMPKEQSLNDKQDFNKM